jgi:hypothetical protein
VSGLIGQRTSAQWAIDNVARGWLHGRVQARFPVLTSLFLLSASLCIADDGGGSWTVIDQDRGITVSKRSAPGCPLPSFRGQGRIKGNVLQLLALMLDLKAVDAWAYGVDSSKPIKRIDERSHLIYLTSDLPWPVRDRDMVVRSDVEVVKPAQEFKISLHCEPTAQPEKSGLIRVKECESTLHLKKIDAETTEVDYVMTLDPAGYLPRWGTEWVTKATPMKTLIALEEQAAASQGKYTAAVRSWSAAL